MAGPTSYVQTSFLGGEISQAAQGRMDLPAYKISMNVCLNGIPMEPGIWQRRPGTRHVAPGRGGKTGKLIKFALAQVGNFAYQMEFTDGFLRFTTGPALVMTNDAQKILAISTANPAVVQTAAAHGWSTGNSTAFNSLGINDALLQNRQFTITEIDATHFSIADAITGATIDGSTLGAFVSGNVSRILEIATTYANGSWSTLRSVQAEQRTMLLNGTHPQVLQVVNPPTATQFATFSLGPTDFIDGPYLDPVAGSIANPGSLNGLVTITLSFTPWNPGVAYTLGAFVSYIGQGYRCILNLSEGNFPNSSPTAWAPINGGAAINGGQGFLPSDIGRAVRLFSEPAQWNPALSYAAGNIVSYPDGQGGNSYWTAADNVPTGIQPGTTTDWALNATGAIWTWGQITSVSGVGLIAPATAIGTLSGGGGLAAAFDGNTSKGLAASANFTTVVATYPAWAPGTYQVNSTVQYGDTIYTALRLVLASAGQPTWSSGTAYTAGQQVQYQGGLYSAISVSFGQVPPSNPSVWNFFGIITSNPPPSAPAGGWIAGGSLPQPSEDFYIGQHYAAPTAIISATLWPSTDSGIANVPNGAVAISIFLRASNTSPASPSSGTILGSVGISNTTSPITITSGDQVSTWSYVWFEVAAIYLQPLPDNGSHSYPIQIGAAQAQFYAPNISNGSVAVVQIRGPALLYNQPVITWQLGVYSDTTGWPTCGCYHESRIWFGGVVSNRFDAAVSNGLIGTQINFAPTAPDGTVSDNNSISYICNGEDSNLFEWFEPDQQGIIVGTQAGEWLISAPSAGALTPTSIKATRITKAGCANALPRRTEHTLVLIQKYGRKVLEYFADVFSGKFSAPDLTDRAKHLTVSGIAEIDYQQELAPTIWHRRNDGALIGATYKRDTLMNSQGPTIIGYHRHLLGSGRLLESLSVGPSIGGNLDAPSFITNDPSTGVRHIEVMSDLLDEGFTLTQCSFVDDGIVPTSTVVQAGPTGGAYGSLLVNGLWPHNGKTVTAWIAGLDCGDYTAASGSITVPFGDGISGGTASGLFTAALVQSFTTLPAVVGFTYNSDGQLCRPVTQADTGTQAGPGFAKFGRAHRAAAFFYGMVNGSIAFGTNFSRFLDPVKLLQPNGVAYTPQQQWSGIWRDNVDSQYDFDNMICFRISRPYPGYVINVGAFNTKADA